MNRERIALLEHFLVEEPTNPFNAYALAIEYQASMPEQARLYFNQLLREHPDYLPTYYHAAALAANSGERKYAEELYQQGMVLAQVQRNQKTFQELQRARQALEDDE